MSVDSWRADSGEQEAVEPVVVYNGVAMYPAWFGTRSAWQEDRVQWDDLGSDDWA